jgi:hypothetical protein
MLLQVHGDHGVESGSLIGLKVAALDEMFRQRSLLLASPGLERGDELDLVDQSVLEREQAEEEVTFGVSGHERASWPRRDGDRVSGLAVVVSAREFYGTRRIIS